MNRHQYSTALRLQEAVRALIDCGPESKIMDDLKHAMEIQRLSQRLMLLCTDTIQDIEVRRNDRRIARGHTHHGTGQI